MITFAIFYSMGIGLLLGIAIGIAIGRGRYAHVPQARADLMNEEARLKLVIADHGDAVSAGERHE